MPIISIEIMKIIDERETPKRQKRTRRDGSNSKRVRAKLFCCAFMLGFLQLLCEASLIFKSNLKLTLLIS